MYVKIMIYAFIMHDSYIYMINRWNMCETHFSVNEHISKQTAAAYIRNMPKFK